MSQQAPSLRGLGAGVGLSVALSVFLAAGASAGPPDSGDSDGGLAESVVTYQGRLTDAEGRPVVGSADLRFQIWNDPVAGSQIGADILRPGIALNEGVFSVDLDLPTGLLDGRALWLRVQTEGTWLLPRQAIRPAPYALGLVPGALVRGDLEHPLLRLEHAGAGIGLAATSADGIAIRAASPLGLGLYAEAGEVPALALLPGQAVVAMGHESGVYAWGGEVGGRFDGRIGVEAGGSSVGVKGSTNSSAEGDAGVLGESVDRQVDGLRGIGAHGVHGIGYTGVYGEGDVGVEGEGIVGVGGQTESGAGVAGKAGSGIGVKGESFSGYGVSGTSQFEHGVYGSTSNGFSAGVAGQGPTGVWGSGAVVGVSGSSSDGAGVLGSTTGNGGIGISGTAAGYAGIGVKGHAELGFGVEGSGEIGVKGSGSTGAGVSGSGHIGVEGSATTPTGTGVHGSGSRGVFGYSGADYGEALSGTGAGSHTEGVLGTASGSQGTGVYGITSGGAGSIGVWGQSNGTYGLYTQQGLYVGGPCVGCLTSLAAVNQGPSALEPGDRVQVTGLAEALVEGGLPSLSVRTPDREAPTSDADLFGVVVSAASLQDLDGRGAMSSSTTPRGASLLVTRPGGCAPGEPLLVALDGLVRVRVAVGTPALAVGAWLVADSRQPERVTLRTARSAGSQLPAFDSEPGFARALEPLAAGGGLVWARLVTR